jgi:hypothetical protein
LLSSKLFWMVFRGWAARDGHIYQQCGVLLQCAVSPQPQRNSSLRLKCWIQVRE